MENALNIIAIVLLVLWLVGYVGFGLATGFIHLLLVLAVIVVLTRLLMDRRPIL